MGQHIPTPFCLSPPSPTSCAGHSACLSCGLLGPGLGAQQPVYVFAVAFLLNCWCKVSCPSRALGCALRGRSPSRKQPHWASFSPLWLLPGETLLIRTPCLWGGWSFQGQVALVSYAEADPRSGCFLEQIRSQWWWGHRRGMAGIAAAQANTQGICTPCPLLGRPLRIISKVYR